MFGWANASNIETCGLGLIELQSDNSLRVSRIFLCDVPSANTSVYCEIDKDEQTRLQSMQTNRKKLYFHWHSHHSMRAFHSGTFSKTRWQSSIMDTSDDESRADKALRDIPWGVSIVINHRREFNARLDLRFPRVAVPLKVVIEKQPKWYKRAVEFFNTVDEIHSKCEKEMIDRF